MVVQYAYDFGNRWVRRVFNAGEVDEHATVFVHDGNQIALQFDATGTNPLTAANLSHRYLWGPSVDQILADEQIGTPGQPGTVLWPLGDHLGSVRDIVNSAGTVVTHRIYDAFGNMQENPGGAPHLFAFTARPLDQHTGLQNNLNRWYDPATGRWISEDPIGFGSGDVNLCRYVLNTPLTHVDPSGKWGELIHYQKTKEWAVALGFAEPGAEAIARADENTDKWTTGTAPIPAPFGDQDYHFNGNRGKSPDTRDQVVEHYMAHADRLLRIQSEAGFTRLQLIASVVGTALHARQDWVAHADHGFSVPKGVSILIVHNSASPQRSYGDPGEYPDNPTLDACKWGNPRVVSPDGRATIPFLRVTTRYKQSTDYACYRNGTGLRRYDLTEKLTKKLLQRFKDSLRDIRTSILVRNYFLAGG